MDTDVVERCLRPDDSAPAAARTSLDAALVRNDVPRDLRADAGIMVSELVTNAITHGAVPVTVLLWHCTPACLVVEVHDASPIHPGLPACVTPEQVDPLVEEGRGLPIVTTLAHRRCGVAEMPGGKSVWFALASGLEIPSPGELAALVRLRLRQWHLPLSARFVGLRLL